MKSDAVKESLSYDHQRLLLEQHVDLVTQNSRSFVSLGVPVPELIQQGYFDLKNAAARFDPKRGCAFSIYASWVIKSGMANLVAQRNPQVSV